MANRSYLYATNFLPSPGDDRGHQRRIVGISEWKTDIPIVFKMLLSGNPKKCRSLIWNVPEEIALVADYEHGTASLFRFLDRIPRPEIVPLREEASRFLTAENNKSPYFLLECAEIFEMEDEPLTLQNDRLLAEIQNVDAAAESILASLSLTHQGDRKRGFLTRIFGHKAPAPEKKDRGQLVGALGLGNWSNFLYYDPTKH
jgi:hypothetical protein